MSRDLFLARRWITGVVVALGLTTPVTAQNLPNGAPAWEVNYGTAQGFGDDSLSAPLALGFTFTALGAPATADILVSSNGFVWLDSTQNSSDYSETVAELLNGAPRICAAWADLTCSDASHDTYFNTFLASGSTPARAVVTWDCEELGSAARVHVQLQLFADHTFSLAYRALEDSLATFRGMICGISPGSGAADPGETDLSTLTSTPSAFGSTLYEYFLDPVGGAGDPRDLAGRVLIFARSSATGGWSAADAGVNLGPLATGVVRGTGCPTASGGAIYEMFDGSGTNDVFDLAAGASITCTFVGNGYVVATGPTGLYDTNIGAQVAWNAGSGDDSLSTQTLPFAFPLPDGCSTSSIDVCSNGFVWLVAGATTSADFSPSPSDFTSSAHPARIAALWADFDNDPASPSGGGTVAFTATGAKATITWDQVPNFGNPGSRSTVQLQMFPNGDFLVAYPAINLGAGGLVADAALIGYTKGFNRSTPPETDYSMALPRVMPFGFVPVEHTCDLAILTTTPTAHATELPSGTRTAVLHVGVDRTSLALDSIGMPGCTAYTLAIVAVLPMSFVSAGEAATSLGPVPNDPGLIGGVFHTQVIAFVPGVHPLQLVASNGWDATIGR